MHSDEPIEPRFVNDSSHRPSQTRLWRAEVASRVCSYRARRKAQKRPGTILRARLRSGSPRRRALASRRGIATPQPTAAQPSRPRRNRRGTYPAAQCLRHKLLSPSERRVHGARIAWRCNVVAARNRRPRDPARGNDAAQSARGTRCETLRDYDRDADPLAERDTPDNDPALDLEIRPTVAADSLLDRYRISAPEAATRAATPARGDPPPRRRREI